VTWEGFQPLSFGNVDRAEQVTAICCSYPVPPVYCCWLWYEEVSDLCSVWMGGGGGGAKGDCDMLPKYSVAHIINNRRLFSQPRPRDYRTSLPSWTLQTVQVASCKKAAWIQANLYLARHGLSRALLHTEILACSHFVPRFERCSISEMLVILDANDVLRTRLGRQASQSCRVVDRLKRTA
jgi:hypothetical protein